MSAFAVGRPRWISPLASDDYREYQDAEFLRRIGLKQYVDGLAAFWPKGGAVWDGLATVTGMGGRQGVSRAQANIGLRAALSGECAPSQTTRPVNRVTPAA